MRTTSGVSHVLVFAAFLAASTLSKLQAMPYASCLTNTAGTINFYLNEPGGNVTITYENGTTNTSFNGVTTGTNLPSGPQSFSLGSHSTYTISVGKTGSGSASFIAGDSLAGSLRGVDVNKNAKSPYFGHVYEGSTAPNIYHLNSDLSGIRTNTAGVSWTTLTRLSVTPDDFLLVGDYSSAGAAVWRIAPDLSGNQLFLGPVGDSAGTAAGVHGEPFSRPLQVGSLANGGSVALYEIDNDFPSAQPNSILVYSNITLAALPWETPPSLVGPEVGLNDAYLNNVYPGLTQGPSGYFYASQYRNNYSLASLQIYDQYLNPLWNSLYAPGTGDYFVTAPPSAPLDIGGVCDSAVSPDGRYVVGLGLNNQMTICSLTNGIPDVSTLYTVSPISTTGNGRGICWDAADNLYISSSGQGQVQSWTLGFTATAVTTGNSNGPTAFSLVLPATVVSVEATNSIASATVSQANSYGNPTNATFVITRTGEIAAPLALSFSLSGTAAAGTYTATSTSNIVFTAGQSSTNITIAAVTDGIPRPTTTIVLTLATSGAYTLAPASATLALINTAPDQVVASALSPTVYNAYSNDYASFTLTRWGDTNAAAFTVSSFTYGGTAVAGVDYTLPTPVTFNPGDLSYTNNIYPLRNGQPPVDSSTNPYVGNKTAIIGAASGSGFAASGTNTALLTILDSAYPTTTVLYADPLTSPTDAANWGMTSANNNMQTNAIDDTVTFGYNLQNGDPGDYGAIPLPPSGAATALRVTVNKDSSQGDGAAAGVNLYPTGKTFSGNYAVRFSMNFIQGFDYSVTTEGPIFGINHSGLDTNWWSGSGISSGWGTPPTNVWGSDGIWYWLDADTGNGGGEYLEYTGLGGTNNNTGWEQLDNAYVTPFTDVFSTNIFTGGVEFGPGLVSNGSVVNGLTANNWADVEIKQLENIVTLSINKTPVFVYTNTTSFTSGTLMLGYDDPFSSVGTLDACVYYSNLRVVSLASPIISQIAVNKANSTAVINFTTVDGDATTASFTLQSASVVTGPYANTAAASITQLSAGAFQAVVPQSGSAQFYRISEQ